MDRSTGKYPARLRATFAYLDDLLRALRLLKERGLDIGAVHSPVPSEEVAALLGERPSAIRLFALCGGIAGVILGFALSAYTAWQWKFIVSARAPVSPIPYVIVAFEFCILLAVFLNVAGLLILSRLPRRKLPASYDPRITEDRFSVVFSCRESEREELRRELGETGAEEIDEV